MGRIPDNLALPTFFPGYREDPPFLDHRSKVCDRNPCRTRGEHNSDRTFAALNALGKV
jgi:hypothetical protein